MKKRTHKASGTVAGDKWVKKTSLVREWEEIKNEVLEHKWYESEKAGRDIGWDRAFVDWLVRHGRKPGK